VWHAGQRFITRGESCVPLPARAGECLAYFEGAAGRRFTETLVERETTMNRRCLSMLLRAAIGSGSLAVLLVGGPGVGEVRAQSVPDRASALEVRTRFLADLDTLQKKFLALANAIPAEKYSWRPGEGVRSVGEAFMHVASEYYVFAPMAYGAAPSPVVGQGRAAFQKFEGMSTQPEVLKHLVEGFAYMKQAVAGVDAGAITGSQNLFGGQRTIIETSLIMSADLHEHLGQLIAYSRMLGFKPPWSQ
jgi:DinB superfamily